MKKIFSLLKDRGFLDFGGRKQIGFSEKDAECEIERPLDF